MPSSVTTFLMFDGRAEEAMTFYSAAFDNAEIVSIERYDVGDAGPEGSVKKAILRLAEQDIICIDSPVPHPFGFTPAISLFVDCADEVEINTLFELLAAGGDVLMPVDAYPFSKRFGWANDRFGVSWQLNLADR